MQLSLLASTPDIAATGYMVNLLLGTPELVAAEAKALGYDGIEFFPGPPGTVGVAEAVAWVRRINHPAFGLMLDTYHLHRKEASVPEGLCAAAGLVQHLHLYDPGRVPPGTQAAPGLDWPAIMATLRDMDYDDAASVCLAPTGDRRAQAYETVSFLRSLLAG